MPGPDDDFWLKVDASVLLDTILDMLHECLNVACRCVRCSRDEVGMTHAHSSSTDLFAFAAGFIDDFSGRDSSVSNAWISKDTPCRLISHGLAGFLGRENILYLHPEPYRILRLEFKYG
jgi:hypothetical protein